MPIIFWHVYDIHWHVIIISSSDIQCHKKTVNFVLIVKRLDHSRCSAIGFARHIPHTIVWRKGDVMNMPTITHTFMTGQPTLRPTPTLKGKGSRTSNLLVKDMFYFCNVGSGGAATKVIGRSQTLSVEVGITTVGSSS